jgi:hypothetical protein
MPCPSSIYTGTGQVYSLSLKIISLHKLMAINVIVWRAYKENHVHLIGKATFKEQDKKHSTFFCLIFIFPCCAASCDLIYLGGKKILLLLNCLKNKGVYTTEGKERRAPSAVLHGEIN